MLSIRRTAGIAILLLVSAGCASVNEGVRVALKSELRLPNAAPSPELIEKHCPFGAPVKAPELDHGPTRLVGRDAYVLEHDAQSKLALWVCGSLDPDVVFGEAEREDRWRPEPDVPSPGRATDNDYKKSGYQRGHMVASEDRVATQELNDETFFLSNAVPQNGPLNGGQWAQLEKAIRSWVENGTLRNARMITGGFFYDPKEDDAATADGLIDFKQIGANKAIK